MANTFDRRRDGASIAPNEGDPLRPLLDGLGQVPRLAWYIGQYLALARMTKPVAAPAELRARMPTFRIVLEGLAELMRADARNLALGVYRLPPEPAGGAIGAIRRAVAFFQDVPRVEARRHARRNSEIFAAPNKGRYPRYYLQNFHYQTDGYLSDRSAALYDHQVEVLFAGGADAMRRMALPALAAAIRERAAAGVRMGAIRHADIATGTGRFLSAIKANFPRLDSVGLDLSRPYLAQAARAVQPWRGTTRLVQGAAEALPFPDGSMDVLTCVYLFHELPPKIRRAAALEFARVLRPGGVLIFVDTLQLGDTPQYDPLLEYFPLAFHEPYYDSFVRCDLHALFAEAGLSVSETHLAYLNKVVVVRKPKGLHGAVTLS